MAVKPFDPLVDADIDGESPVNETGVMKKLRNRDLGLLTQPVEAGIDQVVTTTLGAAFAEIARKPSVYLPDFVSSSEATFNYRFRFRAKMNTAAATGTIRVKLGSAGTFVTQAITDTDTWYTVTLSSTDTVAAAGDGNEKDLIVEARRDTGTGELTFNNDGAGSRVEAT